MSEPHARARERTIFIIVVDGINGMLKVIKLLIEFTIHSSRFPFHINMYYYYWPLVLFVILLIPKSLIHLLDFIATQFSVIILILKFAPLAFVRPVIM